MIAVSGRSGQRKIGGIQSELAGLSAARDKVESHSLFVPELTEDVLILLLQPFPLQHETLLLVLTPLLHPPHQNGVLLRLISAQLLAFHLGPAIDHFLSFLPRPLNLHIFSLTIFFFCRRARDSSCKFPCLRWYFSSFSNSSISLLAWRNEWHFLRSLSLARYTSAASYRLNCDILVRWSSLNRQKQLFQALQKNAISCSQAHLIDFFSALLFFYTLRISRLPNSDRVLLIYCSIWEAYLYRPACRQ